MAPVRFMLCLAAGLLLACPAGAQAARIVVLRADGRTAHRADPGVAAHLQERAGTHSRVLARAATVKKRPKRTVTRELRRLYEQGAIDLATYQARRSAYTSFKAAVKRFSGRRRIDMAGVLGVVDGIAARGQLTPSRLEPLWLTMARNREWWNEGPLLGAGQRVSFTGSELVWQYVAGEGLQIHPLANFGKLNALWRSKSKANALRMQALLDELLPLQAVRAGGTAWEYDYDYGGGRPPWVSGLAQGTGLQAVSRAAAKLGRTDVLQGLATSGLAIFRTPPPEGVAMSGEAGGTDYVQYSFAPGLRILNGFLQSLVGLYDFAQVTGSAEAQQLFAAGDASARSEVPEYDTGAWSLYSRGTSTHESNLNYHEVLRDFLQSLCRRTSAPVYCDTEERFNAYLAQPPQLQLVSRRLRGGRPGALRFRLSKISTVVVRITRGSRLVWASNAVLAGGMKAQGFNVPRRKGVYDVSISATDLAGNSSAVDGTVEVLKPKSRAR